MPDLRKVDDERSKQHWAFVEATSNRVDRWPAWKQAAVTTPTAHNEMDHTQSNDEAEIEYHLPLAGD